MLGHRPICGLRHHRGRCFAAAAGGFGFADPGHATPGQGTAEYQRYLLVLVQGKRLTSLGYWPVSFKYQPVPLRFL
jgi:hypothetical protein